MSNRWLAYFGLRQPYRFERTIIAAVALGLVTLVVATALRLWAADQLHLDGPRAHYFLYLLVTLALSIMLLRWPCSISAVEWAPTCCDSTRSPAIRCCRPTRPSRTASSGMPCCRPCRSPRCNSPAAAGSASATPPKARAARIHRAAWLRGPSSRRTAAR